MRLPQLDSVMELLDSDPHILCSLSGGGATYHAVETQLNRDEETLTCSDFPSTPPKLPHTGMGRTQ